MTAVATEDYLAKYRRQVTIAEAGEALLALHVHKTRGKPLAKAYIAILIALAVEAHAPKEETRHAER